MDVEETLPPLKPSAPGVAFCRKGHKMRVKAQIFRTHQVPGGEMRRIMREAEWDVQKIREALSRFEVKETWLLSYKCETCKTSMIHDGGDEFSESEVKAIAERENNKPLSEIQGN